MKHLLRLLLSSWPLRLPTLAFIYACRAVSRVASVLRTAALFPGPNLPVCHWTVTLKNPQNIRCGTGVVIGPKSTLGASGAIILGDHVRISEQVIIETGGLNFTTPAPYRHVVKPITIGAGVWLGARSTVLPGVTIGPGAIIGAGVIVSRDVPEGAVVVGQPPRLRERASGQTYAGAQ